MKLVTKKGVSRRGDKITVFSKNLCKTIRKRLKLTQKQLPNEVISKVISVSNKEIGNWLLENPEGFKVHKDMGYLAISKYLPREFRDDKEEIIERIKNLDYRKETIAKILKRYEIEYGRKIYPPVNIAKEDMVSDINWNRFLYAYRFMWFNKRNCSIKKASVYRFDASRDLKFKLMGKINDENKEYYEWNFEDFYSYKLKPIE